MTPGDNEPQKIETRIGPLEFTHDFANGFPTDATVARLYDERDFQRACQAYLWSLPAVSFDRPRLELVRVFPVLLANRGLPRSLLAVA